MKNLYRAWRQLFAAATLLLFTLQAGAHQLVLSTGYANSGTPEAGSGLDPHNPPFNGGGGFAAGIRVDIDNPGRNLWISPSFLFWDNLTGSPVNDFHANYFQIEFGGRLYVHTRTNPKFYGGIGAGYSVSHGTLTSRFNPNMPSETYDGDFPTASLHAGVKMPNASSGITVLAEASYHVGLEKSHGFRSIGPARAALIQIGIAFDLLTGGQ